MPRHFLQAAKTAGFGVALAEEVLAEVAGRVEGGLVETIASLPEGFPSALAEVVADGILARASSLDLR